MKSVGGVWSMTVRFVSFAQGIPGAVGPPGLDGKPGDPVSLVSSSSYCTASHH